MSTPAVTVIKNRLGDGSVVDVAQIYRHWDGYPSEHGKDIAAALVAASETPARTWESIDGRTFSQCAINNRNWGAHFLRELFSADADLELIDCSQHYSNNFRYEITGEYDDLYGKVDITPGEFLDRIDVTVHESGFGRGFRRLFDGKAKDYVAWVEKQRS